MSSEVIYDNRFPTKNLINGYATEEIKSDKEMEEYLLTEAKSMLQKESFIDLNNLLEKDGIVRQADKEDYDDYNTYLECKSDRRCLFYFGLEEENIELLGYSRKWKKVVVVLRCR